MVTSDRDEAHPAGWSVRITTQQMSGGSPMQAIYIAGFSSPSDAVEAVRRRDGATPDEKVEALDPMPLSKLAGLGCKPGEVIPWPELPQDLNQRAKSIVDRVTRDG